MSDIPFDLTPTSDDDELCARSRSGDPAALAILYRRHAPVLRRHLRHLAGDAADDLVHETFIRLFEGRGRYRGRGRFRAWLFTIASRLARDQGRQHARRRDLTTEHAADLAPADAIDAEASVDADALARHVESLLDDLPPAYAEAFRQRVGRDLSYREMSALTGEPEGTLRSRVHHALKRIRRAMVEEAGPAARHAPSTEETS